MLTWNRLSVAVVTIATLGLSLCAQAQPSEGLFAVVDGNGNGQVDPDEWDRLPPLRDFARSKGTDLDKPLAKEDFQKLQEGWSEQTRNARPEAPSADTENRDDDRDGDRRDRDRDDDDRDRDREGDRDENRSETSSLVTAPAPLSVPGAVPTTSKVVRAAPRNRAPLILALPEEYKARDTNGDGQIALYEWPRSDFATFRKLDLNGDAFITPRELTAPTTTSVAVNLSTPVTNGPPGFFGGPQGFGGRDRGGRDGGGGREGGGREGGGRRGFGMGFGSDPAARAEMTFNMLDRNRDGSVNPDEFGRSRSIRPMFEKAGIDVSKSMLKADFIANFAKASAAPAQ